MDETTHTDGFIASLLQKFYNVFNVSVIICVGQNVAYDVKKCTLDIFEAQ